MVFEHAVNWILHEIPIVPRRLLVKIVHPATVRISGFGNVLPKLAIANPADDLVSPGVCGLQPYHDVTFER